MFILLLASQLAQINCPEWLPGTNQVLPQGITLTREQKVKNNLRCYCSIVKPSEEECRNLYPPEVCERRTNRWIQENIVNLILTPTPHVKRWRMISIEP